MSSVGAKRRLAFRTICVAAAMVWAVLALMRFVELNRPLLFAIVPVAPWFAALFGLGVAATFGKRAFAASVAAVVVAVGLFLPGTVLPRTGCAVPLGGSDQGLVLLSHNVHWNAGDPTAVADQIVAVGPDVVMLQEADADFLALLNDQLIERLDDRYRYQVASSAPKTTSLATLSRWPLADVIDTHAKPYDQNPFLITTVEAPTGSIRIANVHTSAPISGRLLTRHKNEFRFLDNDARVDDVDILIGDFNASASHTDLRRLTDRGFTDAHREAGCGLGLTWSRGDDQWPALLSLDHVFTAEPGTGGGVAVEGFQILDYASSDHKAIAVEIRSDG